MALHATLITLTGHVGVTDGACLELAGAVAGDAGGEILQGMAHHRWVFGRCGVRVMACQTGRDVVLARHNRVQRSRLGIHLGVTL